MYDWQIKLETIARKTLCFCRIHHTFDGVILLFIVCVKHSSTSKDAPMHTAGSMMQVISIPSQFIH